VGESGGSAEGADVAGHEAITYSVPKSSSQRRAQVSDSLRSESTVGGVAKKPIDICDPQFGQANTAKSGDQVNVNDRPMLSGSGRPHSSVNITHPPLEEVPKPDTAGDRGSGVAESQQLG
jgi:hypothetical protein